MSLIFKTSVPYPAFAVTFSCAVPALALLAHLTHDVLGDLRRHVVPVHVNWWLQSRAI